ncbi:sulfatase/phosphatase domain-containing protein [Maribacter halichondriae]|uniref:sulfatase/phosphatase domain-containing protein n=1 Tax=Maribacter halichondriae TaxID=2980554 RepID=UPI0030761308
MGLLQHMQLSYDLKVPDSIAKTLDIKNWNQLGNRVNRLNAEQRESWDAVYNPIAEKFAMDFKHMNDSTLTVWKYQRYMQDYLGTIAAVDENVGRLLNYLDSKELSKNTIVVYTSDQGFYLGEHGWFDKRFMYNESFKTPLLIRWPNSITAGITSEAMVQNLDFAQTFLEVAGVLPPVDMQGESLVPLLKGEIEKWKRDAVYYHYYEYPAEHAVKRHYGIATEDYKLIHFYYDVDEWELFDRKKDPYEVNNVINDPKYSSIISDLKSKLKTLRKKYGDSDELSDQYIQLYKDKGWIE